MPDLVADAVLFLVKLMLLGFRDVTIVMRGVEPLLVTDPAILSAQVSRLRRG